MRKFELALREYIFTPGRVKRVLTGCTLAPEAKAYRTMLLELFLPPRTQPRRQAKVRALFECILNGDLLNQSLEHYCGPSCCSCIEASQEKVFNGLCAMFYALRPGYFARNDWNAWHAPLRFIGLGFGAHNVLQFVFTKAFSSNNHHYDSEQHDAALESEGAALAATAAEARAAADHDEGVAPDLRHDDAKVLTPQQKSKMKSEALEFINSNWWADFLFLRRSTEAEIAFMRVLLRSGSLSDRSCSLCKEMQGENGSHPLVELSAGTWSSARETCALIQPAYGRQSTGRLQAIHFDCSRCSVTGVWPMHTAFWIVQGACKNQQQDTFTIDVLQDFNTVEALPSEDLHQMLSAVAALVLGCTFTTERLHSRNARRARARVHVARPDAADVGLAHQGWVGAVGLAFLKPLEMCSAKRQRGRPKKTKKKQRQGNASA
eukprot:6471392-Amphidinium_carterae.2